MSNRASDFAQIKQAIKPDIAEESANFAVAGGDSLAILQRMPDACVSLVLCDPPYHTTKKGNIYGDRGFREDEDFLEWIQQYAREWKRILKPNGTVYVYCSALMSARLEVMISDLLRPIAHITWTKPNEPGYDGWKGKMKKEALRTWYPHSERILVFEHGSYGTYEAYRRSPLGEYLLDCRKRAGMTAKYLTEVIGAYGKVNHGGAVANWEAGRNIPSREQYQKIVEVLEGSGKVERMHDYNDIVRPMQLSGDVEFTDCWNFMSVRPFRGKHPAEKPLDMLKHIIAASSYPGDVVLDCFAGSGSTGVAAIQLGRRTVCIDIEEQWVKRSSAEISHASLSDEPILRAHHTKRSDALPPIDSLFD